MIPIADIMCSKITTSVIQGLDSFYILNLLAYRSYKGYRGVVSIVEMTFDFWGGKDKETKPFGVCLFYKGVKRLNVNKTLTPHEPLLSL